MAHKIQPSGPRGRLPCCTSAPHPAAHPAGSPSPDRSFSPLRVWEGWPPLRSPGSPLPAGTGSSPLRPGPPQGLELRLPCGRRGGTPKGRPLAWEWWGGPWTRSASSWPWRWAGPSHAPPWRAALNGPQPGARRAPGVPTLGTSCRKAGGGKSEAGACAERPGLRFSLISLSRGAGCQPSARSRPAGLGRSALPADSAFQVLSKARWPREREKRSGTEGERDLQPFHPNDKSQGGRGPPRCLGGGGSTSQLRQQTQLGISLVQAGQPHFSLVTDAAGGPSARPQEKVSFSGRFFTPEHVREPGGGGYFSTILESESQTQSSPPNAQPGDRSPPWNHHSGLKCLIIPASRE
ncbi:translation initiation factor IF-2-like [Lynx rufus]|uniref:translation initiation factor IF-2-like n=1 Tax=Lynx rufus TaxID=61384 RepID=UPI001F123CD9|nr:translation initiation factor IF-2-like [Lynx rufus]